jgi:hypothetical protein
LNPRDKPPAVAATPMMKLRREREIVAFMTALLNRVAWLRRLWRPA